MKYLILLLLITSALVLTAQNSTYHFQSGFEGSTRLIQYHLNGDTNRNNADIVGVDNGYDWVQDLDKNDDIGNFRIYYEVGDTTKSKASLVQDPVNPNNSVLKFQIFEPHIPNSGEPKGRIQAAINNNSNLKEFYYQVKMYLHPDLDSLRKYPSDITWFTLEEFWNNGANQPYPFRVTLNIQKPKGQGQPLHFGAHGQTRIEKGKWDSKWEVLDSGFAVPLGEWLTLDTYFKEGDSTTGRYKVVMTDSRGRKRVIVDVTGYTFHPQDSDPDGVANFNPMKLYTSGDLINGLRQAGAELSVYWDDFKFWKDSSLVSINATMNWEGARLYPNPSTGIWFVKSDEPIRKLTVLDHVGKQVFLHEGHIDKLDLSRCSSGVYHVLVAYNNGQLATTRILKN